MVPSVATEKIPWHHWGSIPRLSDWQRSALTTTLPQAPFVHVEGKILYFEIHEFTNYDINWKSVLDYRTRLQDRQQKLLWLLPRDITFITEKKTMQHSTLEVNSKCRQNYLHLWAWNSTQQITYSTTGLPNTLNTSNTSWKVELQRNSKPVISTQKTCDLVTSEVLFDVLGEFG